MDPHATGSTLNPSKIVCVGRNYSAHAEEMGNDVPSEPLIFLKPPSALIGSGDVIRIPPGVGRVDFEGEIALVIGRRGRRVPREDAWSIVSGIAALNDVTARELQRSDAQWTRAKGFDGFCPVGAPSPLDQVDWEHATLETRVNGELRQHATTRQMVFDVPELIAYISGIMTLEPGDVIATGTPEGVGALSPGDEVSVRVSGVAELLNTVSGEDA